MYLTHNNHFQFGWGNGVFNFENMTGPYWVEFGKAQYLPTSFREECVRAARLIGENVSKPVLILFSGGIDSEVVVRSFQEAGVKFTVMIANIIHNNNIINSHDTTYAYDYVVRHNIPYFSVDYDLDFFIRNKLEIEADRFNVGYEWPILIHADMVKLYPKFHCVLGGGDLALKRHRYNGRNLEGLYLEEEVISVAVMEAAVSVGSTASNRFFMHTPELMLSWLLDPDVHHWIKYEKGLSSEYGVINYYGIKYYSYFRHWPDIVPRPKYNGLESLELKKIQQYFQGIKTDYVPQGDLPGIINHVRSRNKKEEILINYRDLLNRLIP